MSPLNTDWPLASLICTLCGVPASWLSKWTVNADPAGAVTLGVVNAMPDAVMSTTLPPADADGTAEPDGARLAEPDGAALPDGAANSSFQQSGKGVASGAGLYV